MGKRGRDGPLEETRPTGHGRARGLVSSRVSGRRVEARTFAPGPALAPWVECLWLARWDLRGQDPHVTELLGDPAVHLSFEGGAARLVGVWTRLWTRTLSDRGHVRALKLHPGAAQVLLPGPVHRWTNRVTPLGEALGEDLSALVAAVDGPEDDADGLAALERWATERLAPDAAAAEVVAWVREARSRSDLTRVDDWAARVGVSVAVLQRQLRAHLGAAPKWVLRRYRLQEAALAIEAGRAPDLTELALALGYADQAHLSRDFKAAVGRAPRAFERALR
jgi:AraC-like DNA-binding protein